MTSASDWQLSAAGGRGKIAPPLQNRAKPLTSVITRIIFTAMDTSRAGNIAREANAARPDTMDRVLATAVNMEEDISAGVYRDYLSRRNWPRQLDEQAFAEIRKRLTVLLKGIEKHKRIINALVREHGRDR